ncbi:ATP-binding cassette domain-containing protein, partial [Acinetobacter baumannii]
ENLVVEYSVGGKTIHAVSDVSLDIARGETLGLVGESGCGKSTLLKMISGLLPPTTGQVLVDGEPVTKPHGNVGIVFQNALLLPWR